MSSTQRLWDPNVISWLHFGDLHITDSTGESYQNLVDLIQDAECHLRDGVAFALLPGDNTDDGTEAQYRLLRSALLQLSIPVFAIPGDHDAKSGSLEPFRNYLGGGRLYAGFQLGHYYFALLNALDSSTPGQFGAGQDQLDWLTTQLEQAADKGLRSVLFLHTYPSDLIEGRELIRALLQRHRVLLVDMGHTHYNELANDGTTIYATTRSTGQIEEGPPGFSIVTLDHNVVSWKFKEFGPWPFVTITSPVDKRLITDPSNPDQVVRGEVTLRARVWNRDGARIVVASVDDKAPQPMYRSNKGPYWSFLWNSARVSNGEHVIRVTAADYQSRIAADQITVLVDQAGIYAAPPRKPRDEDNAIGAYPSKGILGTRLGPNKNGTKGPWPSWRHKRWLQRIPTSAQAPCR